MGLRLPDVAMGKAAAERLIERGALSSGAFWTDDRREQAIAVTNGQARVVAQDVAGLEPELFLVR